MILNWLKNYNLLTFETVDSTNSEALRLASSGAKGNFVILSLEQTGGRGQKGREWVSFLDNLHASILLCSKSDPKKHPQISFVIANAMYDAIAFLSAKHKLNVDIKLKWPNDVMIDGKKVAGILLESISIAGNNYVVVGFGVNIVEAPKSVNYPTTSLALEGVDTDSDEFLNILMNKFEKRYTQWLLSNDFSKTREAWLKRGYNLNKVITVDDGINKISGIFKEIDFDGSMKIELASGQIRNVAAGDMFLGNGS